MELQQRPLIVLGCPLGASGKWPPSWLSSSVTGGGETSPGPGEIVGDRHRQSGRHRWGEAEPHRSPTDWVHTLSFTMLHNPCVRPVALSGKRGSSHHAKCQAYVRQLHTRERPGFEGDHLKCLERGPGLHFTVEWGDDWRLSTSWVLSDSLPGAAYLQHTGRRGGPAGRGGAWGSHSQSVLLPGLSRQV